ncbi:MAG: ribokinase [Alphaproteobacteria bacterium PRO2]|nr:ribokinase [Alphaproteobacteria bacterium PRO2]
MLPQIIAQIGVPVLVAILSDALGKMNSPLSQTAADALGKITGAIQTGEISSEQIAEANRHAEKMAELEIQQNQLLLSETAQSLRAEIASDDKFVRRMRPTFGYFMAVTWAAQMLAIAYVIVFQTEKSAFVLNAMGNLSAIWAMGLSVLGIYVYKRSEEKKKPAHGPEIIGWNNAKP